MAALHPLDGPRFKIARANEHIGVLRRAETAFRQQADYEVIRAELDPKTGQYAYRLRVKSAPLSLGTWGVLIGEIAYVQRSALDGLVHQLVLLNGQHPDHLTQFPIFLVGRTFERRKSRGKGQPSLIPHFEGMDGADGRRMLQGVRLEHQAIIERLQPYQRGRGGKRSYLYLLKEVNNADKHQFMQVVGVSQAIGPAVTHWQGETISVVYAKRPMFEDGAKILDASPNVVVNPRVTPRVSFAHGCPAVVGRSVITVLHNAIEQASEAVESFGVEFPS